MPGVRAGLAGFLVMAGLGTGMMAAKPHSSDLTGSSWRLVEFKGSDDKVLKPADRNKYTVVFGDGGRLSAVVDCNRGHGTWSSDGPGHLTFSPLGLTRMMCGESELNSNLETQWENVTSYVLKSGRLYLSLKTDAGKYEFEPLPGSKRLPTEQTASSEGAPVLTEVSLTGTDWRLVKLGDEAVEVKDPQRAPHILLDAKTHRMSGSGGCNRLMGGWKVNGDHITFSQTASTMMACVEGMETEQKFLKALGSASQWKITDGRLKLMDDSGGVLAEFEGK
jgi:heat shock protein HslJ